MRSVAATKQPPLAKQRQRSALAAASSKCSAAVSRMDPNEANLKAKIEKAFVETGEQQRLYQTVKARLTQMGWTDAVRKLCQGTLIYAL